jgi:hypothetical protein
MWGYALLFLALIVACLIYTGGCGRREKEHFIERAMAELRNTERIPDISLDELDYMDRNKDMIDIVANKEPSGRGDWYESSFEDADHPRIPDAEYFGPEGSTKETLFHPSNAGYWPNHFYGNPLRYKSGGGWPPNMFSRSYNWEPGFSTGSGWSFWMRPGMSYQKWPRNRWVRNNHKFYYINNGTDRAHDYDQS